MIRQHYAMINENKMTKNITSLKTNLSQNGASTTAASMRIIRSVNGMLMTVHPKPETKQ